MKESDSQPIFILGFPRSGTTLLRSILGNLPEVEMHNEPELLRALRALGFELTDTVDSAAVTTIYQRLAKDRPPPHVPTDASAGVRDIYRDLLQLGPARVWGEKSIGNAFFIDQIGVAFPNALVIHLVRDPRAIAASLQAKRPGNLTVNSAFHIAARWRAWTTHIVDSLARLPGDHVMLRFEDLVADTATAIADIAQRVGVQFTDAVLDTSRRQDDVVLHGAAGVARAHRLIASDIDPTRALHTTGSAGTDRAVVAAAGRVMLELGYRVRPIERYLGAPLVRITHPRLRRYSAERAAQETRNRVGSPELFDAI